MCILYFLAQHLTPKLAKVVNGFIIGNKLKMVELLGDLIKKARLNVATIGKE